MEIISLFSDDAMANFSYLIVNEAKAAYCVDPWDGDRIHDVLDNRGLTLMGIINTHLHFDHTRGNEALSALTGARIFTKDLLLAQEDINIGDGAAMAFVDANGHTMDHLVILLKEKVNQVKAAQDKERIVGVISGDLLFNCGVGNCKNGGDVDLLFESVRKINAILPDDATLYPGHDYLETNLGFAMANGVEKAGEMLDALDGKPYRHTTMGLERELNPFLQADSLDTFRKLRRLRDQW